MDEQTYDDVVIPKLRIMLKTLIERGGSDLHYKAGSRVHARVNGEIEPLTDEPIAHDESIALAKEILRSRFDELIKNKEIDLTFRLDDEYRFRVNLFFQKDGISAVFRTIPVNIPSFDKLELPQTIRKLASLHRGLILVTGVTGSGKSTTLAAIIDLINSTMNKHVITIEDPIEFIHKDKRSIVNQRSIGEDTLSFKHALRAALREDPDIILVGEMRDLDTIEIALHAAETGHLVFSTLHTTDTKETINRIIGMFPSNEQNRIRLSLAQNLAAVVSQRLVPTKEGKRCAAIELLLKTPRISELILSNRDKEIRDAVEEGRDAYGTQTFDQALLELIKSDKIYIDDALAYATNPDNLKLILQGVGGTKKTDDGSINAYKKNDDDDGPIKLKL